MGVSVGAGAGAGVIRRLSPSVINQIAAGEVVERPASVVKELLENAIDAGASRVDLTVERGGKDLVRVADNGKGIDRDDLPIAFEPHATSKLACAEDLSGIRTLGFRGEALAAIAEISRVRCLSRPGDAETGHELAIDAGVAAEIKECACDYGTVMEVRNLFHNVPVRRAFLKSDATEAGHVAESFARVALAHPAVHFTFRSAGRLIHDLPAVTGLRERISVFHGRELADSLLWVESRFGDYHLWGYVGHPSQSRPSNKGQYLFIGGRYVRDRSLSHALAEAYRGLLMVNRMPVAYVCLEAPAEDVDVNVHPTKIEVRFRDGHAVYARLLAAIRQTFLKSDLHARLQAPRNGREEAPVPAATSVAPTGFALASAPAERQSVNDWFRTPEPAAQPRYARSETSSSYPLPPEPAWASALPPAPGLAAAAPFDEFASAPIAPVRTSSAPELPFPVETDAPAGPAERSTPHGASGNAPDLQELAEVHRAIQLHGSYLVAETSEGMVVIDQHALHERILYEELRDRLEQGGVESQRLLTPEPVELAAGEASELLERTEALAKLGFVIEPFGGDTVVVHGMPALLGSVAPERLVRDLAELFRSKPLPPTRDAVLEEILATIACKAAVKAGQKLSPEEIQALLARRHLAADTHHCPHGRPAALVFTKNELERQFGRI